MYCDKHHKTNMRHGHPEQIRVKVADVEPVTRHIARWIARRRNKQQIWQSLHRAWAKCLDNAEASLREIEDKPAFITWQRDALLDIVKTAQDADRDKIILTVMAVAYLSADDPRRFKSDRAVRFAVARRFRGLTDMHVATYWGHSTGRVHRVYRDPAPRHSEFLGQMLMEAVGFHGLAIQGTETEERVKAQRDRAEAQNAIAASEPLGRGPAVAA